MSFLLFVTGFIGVVIVGSLVVYGVGLYNSLVRLDKNCEKAWSNIDVLLKQRSDELPKLIDTAKQYMDYEQETLQQVIEARSQVQQASGPKEEAQADSMLKGALGNFFALAEDYPELKANENFTQLQGRISDIEERIADRREYYNEAATTHNTRIEQVPYIVIAGPLGFTEKELFEATAEDRQDVDVGAAFDA
jgi:LemA protein